MDSGASCIVLPKEESIRIPARRQRLRAGTRVRCYGAKNGYLTVVGIHMAKVVASGVVHLKDFVVVDEPGQLSILGPLSSQRLNLIHELIP